MGFTYHCLPICCNSNKNFRSRDLVFAVIYQIIDLGSKGKYVFPTRLTQLKIWIVHQPLVELAEGCKHIDISFQEHDCLIGFVFVTLDDLEIVRRVYDVWLIRITGCLNSQMTLEISLVTLHSHSCCGDSPLLLLRLLATEYTNATLLLTSGTGADVLPEWI